MAARQRDCVEEYIRVGVAEGGRLVTGGGRPKDLPVGYYVEPSVCLSGGIFTTDSVRGAAVARKIRTGSIGVNFNALPLEMPFGAVKFSGIGRELGPESVDAYSELQSILCGAAGNPLLPE